MDWASNLKPSYCGTGLPACHISNSSVPGESGFCCGAAIARSRPLEKGAGLHRQSRGRQRRATVRRDRWPVPLRRARARRTRPMWSSILNGSRAAASKLKKRVPARFRPNWPETFNNPFVINEAKERTGQFGRFASIPAPRRSPAAAPRCAAHPATAAPELPIHAVKN